MHETCIRTMKKFFENYVPDVEQNILDLGSMVLPHQKRFGSFRDLASNPKWNYTGADIGAGDNVDVVMEDGLVFPFADESFDVVISANTLEHVDFPWVFMREVVRVMKTKGLCCIIAPSRAPKHRYPIDTFRYFPDGMVALCKWSGLIPIRTRRNIAGHNVTDCYLIAQKP